MTITSTETTITIDGNNYDIADIQFVELDYEEQCVNMPISGEMFCAFQGTTVNGSTPATVADLYDALKAIKLS